VVDRVGLSESLEFAVFVLEILPQQANFPELPNLVGERLVFYGVFFGLYVYKDRREEWQ